MRAYLFLKESEELINKNYKKLKSIKIKRKLDDSIYLELAKIVTFDSLNSYDDFCFYFLNKITAYNIFIMQLSALIFGLWRLRRCRGLQTGRRSRIWLLSWPGAFWSPSRRIT